MGWEGRKDEINISMNTCLIIWLAHAIYHHSKRPFTFTVLLLLCFYHVEEPVSCVTVVSHEDTLPAGIKQVYLWLKMYE